MAKYKSAEEQFDCPGCNIRFTLREAIVYRSEVTATYLCPLCNNGLFVMEAQSGRRIVLWQSHD